MKEGGKKIDKRQKIQFHTNTPTHSLHGLYIVPGTHGITDSVDMSLSRLQETVKDREGGLTCSIHGVTKSQTGLSD